MAARPARKSPSITILIPGGEQEARLLPGTLVAIPWAWWETAWNGQQAKGLGAWTDGFIPFVDPFAHNGYYDPSDPIYQNCQFLGGISRDALLMAMIPNLALWSSSRYAPFLYELGSTTVAPEIYTEIQLMNAVEKGALPWTKFGLKGYFLTGRALPQLLKTWKTFGTPGARILGVIGLHVFDVLLPRIIEGLRNI